MSACAADTWAAILDAETVADAGLADACGVSSRRPLTVSAGSVIGGSSTEGGALSTTVRREETDPTLRALNEDMERGATGGEGGTVTLGTTVVVTVAVGSGPLVPTIGDDDRGGAADAA